MPRISCSKGHIYDSAIYGDNCPFCPSQGTGTAVNNDTFGGGATVGNFGSGTEVNQSGGRTQVSGGTVGGGSPTIPMGGGNYGGGVSGGTVIRPAGGGTGMPQGKRIVGLLFSYDTTPTGQIFNIHEGRNLIGRDANNDICIAGDAQVSGKHSIIQYLSADGKFRIKDELSSNGTFVNEELKTDVYELASFDVIRVGSTKLIFIAIPQIP
ncbi:MAG: FHA domain-containing protein [Dysgonamonadaceae bacterium]|jgi:hypothetical protein|nr:FHA domain-containing protein [Dysgonamonadaceae bacterium]